MIAVERLQDGWRIPIEGFVAIGCELGVWGSDLQLVRHGDHALLRLSVDHADAVAALAEARAVVDHAFASIDSTLSVDFGGAGTIVVPAAGYEAWEINGPGRLVVVAPAGGGKPAIWDDSTPTRTITKEEL
jgi:hypothetical protein